MDIRTNSGCFPIQHLIGCYYRDGVCLLLSTNLTFREPCIVIYSYNKSQQNALLHKFILVKNSTSFGQIYCPSSGASTLYTQP